MVPATFVRHSIATKYTIRPFICGQTNVKITIDIICNWQPTVANYFMKNLLNYIPVNKALRTLLYGQANCANDIGGNGHYAAHLLIYGHSILYISSPYWIHVYS